MEAWCGNNALVLIQRYSQHSVHKNTLNEYCPRLRILSWEDCTSASPPGNNIQTTNSLALPISAVREEDPIGNESRGTKRGARASQASPSVEHRLVYENLLFDIEIMTGAETKIGTYY